MCPICIGAAAWATLAGTSSAGGVAALAAVKLHIKRRPDSERAARKPEKSDLQRQQAGGGK